MDQSMNIVFKRITLAILMTLACVGSSVGQSEEIDKLRVKAEAGDADAQRHLGFMYDLGRGVLEDDKEAVKWYRKAAEQGNADPQFLLGVMYALGRGVLEDSVAAYAWWNIASTNGNSDARSNKDKLAKQMTREQIAEAQKLSRKLYDEIEARKAKKK